MKVVISKNNIQIQDSYLITSKSSMTRILNNIRENYKDKNINVLSERTNKSLINEWRGHNLLYKLGLFRSHTKDVDFEYPQKWYNKIVYSIIGL